MGLFKNRKLENAEALIRELNMQLTEGKHLIDTLADKLEAKNNDIEVLSAHNDDLEERLRTSEEARTVLEQRISELNLAVAFAREGKFADALRELEREPLKVEVAVKPRAMAPGAGGGAANAGVGPESLREAQDWLEGTANLPGEAAAGTRDCAHSPVEELRREVHPGEGHRAALLSAQTTSGGLMAANTGYFSLADTSARWNLSPQAQNEAASRGAHADQHSAAEMEDGATGVGGLNEPPGGNKQGAASTEDGQDFSPACAASVSAASDRCELNAVSSETLVTCTETQASEPPDIRGAPVQGACRD